ncbi:threonine/serine exporter family protein [Anaerobacillus sp. CMMVII]|uniref:threonine/serine exporter family protein n=1 Tax=Anaerobacillus sp. CMMVII TaxID=2755588 RepID=UPI0021B7C018|nr:threonine/serine exporter family protein [Anaerobacillus sp. CMMVII]MCT8136385.1 threonine/serine exporter family protein [Anaerobacillus sp. CMMVII]
MIVELIVCFFATVSFGIIFSVPRNSLLIGGAIGMLAWSIFRILPDFGVTSIFATSIASITAATLAQFLSRRFRIPATAFTIPGIIPLVPGSKAYYTMLAFVDSDYIGGLELGIETMLQAGAIAAGIVFALAVFSFGKGIGHRYEAGR